MVDRITPATTDDDVAEVARLTGYYDPAAVFHEPFRQWVIEDTFVEGARPDWHLVGAELVQDVAAHEAMKLRCLNGAHSTLAYLGYLSGHTTVSATMADPLFRSLLKTLWRNEIIPSLTPPQGVDMHAYCDDLATRFENPRIHHKTWQIAMDGSQKLPQRLLATISDNLQAGRPSAALTLAVAAWMRYVSGTDENGADIDVRDPLARQLSEAAHSAPTAAQKVTAIMNLGSVFPTELSQNPTFQSNLSVALDTLTTHGARAAIKRTLEENELN